MSRSRKFVIRSLLLLFTLACAADNALSQSADYTLYHRDIITAEQAIFIAHDSISGLQLFKKSFDQFGFVYVDDCIEAFQLALYFKREDLAMQFLKKALANGFELKLLDELALTHSYPQKKVTLHYEFISKHKAELERYSDACYDKYIARIDKNLLAALIKRHVREQLFKNYHAGLGMTMKDQEKAYLDVCNDNLRFIDSLAKQNIFLGERNLGIYTNKMAARLDLPYKTIENCLAEMLRFYGLPANTQVPVNTEYDYYEVNPVYNMLFHNQRSYDVLLQYRDDAIRKGYWHPREFASLRSNHHANREKEQLYLLPPFKDIADTKELDERRRKQLLTSYELDQAKYRFQQQHDILLFFGFRNGTR